MQTIVVISGSGISEESGIPTFRGMGGLWNNYNFTELASPDAWERDPKLVLDFYNFRRKGVVEAKPNIAHKILKSLEDEYKVRIVTQNVDDLHERSGSSEILHLHGEIRKARSTKDSSIVLDIDGDELNIGDLCPLGSQLRPHIVWFGEAVDAIPQAVEIVKSADIVLVVGTSLQVYPAASLVHYAEKAHKKFIIDPSDDFTGINDFIHIKEKAGKGMQIFKDKIKE